MSVRVRIEHGNVVAERLTGVNRGGNTSSLAIATLGTENGTVELDVIAGVAKTTPLQVSQGKRFCREKELPFPRHEFAIRVGET